MKYLIFALIVAIAFADYDDDCKSGLDCKVSYCCNKDTKKCDFLTSTKCMKKKLNEECSANADCGSECCYNLNPICISPPAEGADDYCMAGMFMMIIYIVIGVVVVAALGVGVMIFLKKRKAAAEYQELTH